MATLSNPPFIHKVLTEEGTVSVAWFSWFNEIHTILNALDLNLLGTNTISTSATSDFTSNIGKVYNEYVITLSNIKMTTNNEQLTLVGSTNTGSSYLSGSNDYSWVYETHDINGTTVTEESAGDDTDTSIKLTGADIGNATNDQLNGEIVISTPSNASNHKLINYKITYTDSDGYLKMVNGTAKINTTTAIDAIRLATITNTIASGTIKLYGRK